MSDAVTLKDLFTKKQFDHIDKTFSQNFDMPIEVSRNNGIAVRNMCSKDCGNDFCKLVKSSATGARRCKQDKLRSMSVAFETGQPYISLCHAGIVLVCVPIMEHDTPLGGVFFGKCLWDAPDETVVEDIKKRLKGLRLDDKLVAKAVKKLDIINGRKIHEASEFLFILLYETTALDPRIINWRRQRSQQQSQISDFIQESKRTGLETRYPYESEQQLIGKVKIGDRTGAKEILNCLLGTIMFHNPGQLNVLKARMVELLSILSRAAAEGGVDINALLEKNMAYISKVMDIDTQADLCVWISSALNEFIESVYSSQDSKKITQIKPAIDFIERNYFHPITLSDIASAAFLSVSRLAHLFKEQMGITIIDYLTNIRINCAKELLLSTEKSCTQVCFEVGYNNQSYFTRTFKEIVGTTPRRFREQNRRGPATSAIAI